MTVPDPRLFRVFPRSGWAALRGDVPSSVPEAHLSGIGGMNTPITSGEIEEIFLPLSRLLRLRAAAARETLRATGAFLGEAPGPSPYIIGIAGSVAAGKSTLARAVQAVLRGWPEGPTVEIVTTDGFLRPTSWLEEHGLMSRKGFPESYDLHRMIRFLVDVGTGAPEVRAPVYSHRLYDIVPGEFHVVRRPDVLIFEGLNVLGLANDARLVVSDFFDFSIYLDAAPEDLETWFVERRLMLQRTAFRDPSSRFHHHRDLPVEQARAVALDIWRTINLANLKDHILPTRERADLVFRKRRDHAIGEVWLRR